MKKFILRLPRQLVCRGKSVAAHRILTKRALFSLRVVLIASAFVLLSACSVKKHTVTATQQQVQTTGSHTSVQALQSFDSLLHTLDFSADSVVIRMEHPSNSYCEDRGRTAAALNSPSEFPCSKPVLTITAHQPRVRSSKQANNRVFAQKVEQDTVATQNLANSHAEVSNDTLGVAKPMNGTVVAVIVILAVLIVATIVILIYKSKTRFLI